MIKWIALALVLTGCSMITALFEDCLHLCTYKSLNAIRNMRNRKNELQYVIFKSLVFIDFQGVGVIHINVV